MEKQLDLIKFVERQRFLLLAAFSNLSWRQRLKLQKLSSLKLSEETSSGNNSDALDHLVGRYETVFLAMATQSADAKDPVEKRLSLIDKVTA
mmetsp:Transcript_3509/g.4440  ORF Transcript_3509/g.4440 Transcript_3509/m.4440 type:complete len:92 (-) Transcript_3509:323-598(-)